MSGWRDSAQPDDAGAVLGRIPTVGVETGDRPEIPRQRGAVDIAPIVMGRVAAALERLHIRYFSDRQGSLLGMWERYALLFALEGPGDEILVMRARTYESVPAEWDNRAYTAVNEWNHTRRFFKAYVGDPNERGALPIYAEMQVPLASGLHDGLLEELVECAVSVAGSFIEWLYSEGALL